MSDKEKLSALRSQIDQIDEDIISLLRERLNLTGQIGRLKERLNKPVIDRDREADLNARLDKICREKGLDASFILKIWRLILQESYRVQDGKK